MLHSHISRRALGASYLKAAGLSCRRERRSFFDRFWALHTMVDRFLDPQTVQRAAAYREDSTCPDFKWIDMRPRTRQSRSFA